MSTKFRIYASVLSLALVGAFFMWFSSPSRAEVTAGSDGSVYLYDTNYAIQEADTYRWQFNQEVYASESNTTASDAFSCPAEATGAYTFISDRGQERTGLNGWNAAAVQIFPSGSKDLLEVNFTPAANILSLKLGQASIKQAGGQYSLGVACTTNNGVTVVKSWYRYIEVTAVTGEWFALPNGDGSTGGGDNGGGDNGGGTGGGENGGVDPTLGLGTEGLTLTPATTESWVRESIYYNLNPRTFSSTKNLDGVTARIAALKNLGVGAIILEPIFPVSQTGKPGTVGDIYAPSDFASIDPSLGTTTDLAELTTAAHAANIKVLLTWVSGQVGNDVAWFADNPDWILKQGINTARPVGKPYAALLDYSAVGLKAKLITDMTNWVTNNQIDGFVSATASAQPVDFWDEATYRVNKVRPTVFLSTGTLSADYLAHSFAGAIAPNVVTVANAMSKGTSTNVAWNALLKTLGTKSSASANINYLTDYNALIAAKTDAARFGNFLNSALVFTYLAPGTPMLQAGQEIAYAKVPSQINAENIVWPTKAHPTTALLGKLAKTKAALGLTSRSATTALVSANKSLFAFKRVGSSGTLFYIANLSTKSVTAKLTFGAKYTVYDLAGKKITLVASQNVTVPAAGFVVYSTKLVK